MKKKDDDEKPSLKEKPEWRKTSNRIFGGGLKESSRNASVSNPEMTETHADQSDNEKDRNSQEREQVRKDRKND